MKFKKKITFFYHRTSFRVIAGGLVAAIFFSMVLQPAIFVAIKSGAGKADAAVNYLVDNTEFVNKSPHQRVMDYLETFSAKDTLLDYYKLASVQIAREEYDQALESIEKCIALYNDEDEELYIDLLLKQGCLYVMLADYDAALLSLDLALEQDTTAADIYLIKAQIYSEQENMDSLVESLTKYLELVPDDSEVRSLLAQANSVDRNNETASQQYSEVLEKAQDIEKEYENDYLQGLNAVKNSDFAAGVAYLTSAIEKDDSLEGIFYYRGICMMALGNYVEAIQDFTSAIEKNDMLQASYFSRGVSLFGDHQYEKGLADIEYAIHLNEDEEITEQAQLLIAELEAAQRMEAVPPEELEESKDEDSSEKEVTP